MPTLTSTNGTPEERKSEARAIASVAELRQLGLQAPHGGVIDACEARALSQGGDFLRDSLTRVVQARIDELEKKSRPLAEPGTCFASHGNPPIR